MGNRKDVPQAALHLMFSNAPNSIRPLSREATIIGRARTCDIILDAADISTLHCVITRNSGGFSIRDCGSRAGLRINGDIVAEGTLHDGDVLQIGPFSFRVTLPPREKESSSVRDLRLRHLDQSRRNLARLALTLRRRLAKQQAKAKFDVSKQSDYQRDLSEKASGLRLRVQDYERRLADLELAEREVSRDRELLNREFDELRGQSLRTEQEIAQRREEFEKQLRSRHQEQKQAEEELRREQGRVAAERDRLNMDRKKLEEHLLKQDTLLAQEREHLAAERQVLAAERKRLEAQLRDNERLASHRQDWHQQREELEKLAAQLQQALSGIRQFHDASPAVPPERATVS
jgi:pSer/pThr/pTyr-binding forkhead associated (FHA) protein